MKKIILAVAILAAALTFTSCEKKDIKPTTPIENPIDTNYVQMLIKNTGSSVDTVEYQINNISQLDSSYNVYQHTVFPQDSDSTYFEFKRGETYRFLIYSHLNDSHTWIYINGELDFHSGGTYYYDKTIN